MWQNLVALAKVGKDKKGKCVPNNAFISIQGPAFDAGFPIVKSKVIEKKTRDKLETGRFCNKIKGAKPFWRDLSKLHLVSYTT